MKVLIIGLGSIALKHLSALKVLEPNSQVFALRSGKSKTEVAGVKNLYEWKEVPDDIDFILISNTTNEHYDTINKSLEFKVPLFIEKPPFENIEGVDKILKKAEKYGVRTYTAFNIRFHPVIKWLKENLADKRVLEVQAYCGSYLPEWRPGRDYREVYSAKRKLGGGVHLDLIHELDFLIWLFNKPEKINSFLSKVSPLETDSIDCAHYWLQYKEFNISILLNYYRRDAKRNIEIVMENETWTADLINSTIKNSNNKLIFQDHHSIIDTYLEQMKYFLNELNSEKNYMNHLAESINTLKYCLQ